VLAACSTHFQSLFKNAPVNATHTQLFVILDGTRADDLQILLQFMYRGEAYLHQDRIESVIKTAELLQIKGLCEGPKTQDISDLGGGSTSLGLTPGSSGGGPSSGSASNARLWPLPSHSPPPHRSSVGIMGNRHIRKAADYRDHSHRSELHRDLSVSPSSQIRSLHLASAGSASDDHPARRLAASPPPDHQFTFPTSRASNADYASVYSTSAGNFKFFGGSSRDFAPPERDRSPLPSSRGGRNYGSASSTPIPMKEDRDDFYPDHPGRAASGSRSGSIVGGDHRATPASDKASDRHTPASHHGGPDRDYEPGRSRNSPTSPMASSSKFPSDSTTDYAKAISSSNLKQERIRRTSDSASVTGNTALGGDGSDVDSRNERKFTIQDYRREAEQHMRERSPSGGRPSDIRMNDEEARVNQARLEAIRQQIAQAQAERDRFLPAAAGVLHGGINAATIAAQGLQATSASDLMRLAVPVRDPENGDAISGSGSKLKCPFCERTYGYETNLRAHIRQRHQGIRVSCPHCPRTFTRNNTVRRHIQREHRGMSARIPQKFGSTRVMPDPIRLGNFAASAAIAMSNSNNLGRPDNVVDTGNNGPDHSPTSPSSQPPSGP
jgi:hypothetical protein